MKRPLAALAALSVAGALALAPPVAADPGGCETVAWGFLFSQRRSICDGPVKPDGSWWRQRSIWVPAHTASTYTYCSGGSYSAFCTTSGGGFIPYTELAYDAYPVTPDTVPTGEPDHLQ